MTDRTLFGKPIREATTAAFYPSKLTIDQFVKLVKLNIEPFAKNMKALGSPAADDSFVELWFEALMAWSEVENE